MNYISRHYLVEASYDERLKTSRKIPLRLGRHSPLDGRLSVKRLFLADMLSLYMILIGKRHIHRSRSNNIWKILHNLKNI
jgi:hypothetical protein